MPEDGLEAQSALQQPKSGSIYTALAQSATRTAALYFSRPVRLFRPSKLSGWQQLRAQAHESGHVLNVRYMIWIIRNQFTVLPKHFLPPIAVNATLGTVLWATYTEVSSALEDSWGHHPTVVASIAGGAAGAMQAVAAAPVENVRMIVEGGTARAGWANAWQEVFRRSQHLDPVHGNGSTNLSNKKAQEIKKVREVRDWVGDVRGMAGRGWEGWGWGVAKDTCGFAVFFAVFELTRRVATHSKAISENVAGFIAFKDEKAQAIQRHAPRTIHGFTLVTGGVIAGLGYEMITRPWDAARRAVHLREIVPGEGTRYTRFRVLEAVVGLYKTQGLAGFFRDPSVAAMPEAEKVSRTAVDRLRQRLWTTARVLGRVGPWGVGFLVWEMVS